ncbi:hypothetical protein PV08_11047 [Exophiala spinifera]|uniref:Protein kinase domain-containing protein n=1 Tax=Exophiala spinifera TaxID=91928 RepID=A0A0D1ZAP8_9EURO|nr:uncharacterized protein PV08_11047 [Exophiala spinifera]KIW10087.1 hypothetical protein PV08_11047 [Exophiala spinifera]
MAEFLSVELVLMIAKDVYLVSKWTYETVSVAQRADEHLAELKRRFEVQLDKIRGFANIYLRDLPPGNERKYPWLRDVKLKYEDLQKLLAGGWTRLALKYDPTYKQFYKAYTTATLEQDPSHLQIPGNREQWLIEDTASPTTSAQLPMTYMPLPLGENVNGQVSESFRREHSGFHQWRSDYKSAKSKIKASINSTVARYKFAGWDKKRMERTLSEVESITDRLFALVPFVMATHPRFPSHSDTKVEVREGVLEAFHQLLGENLGSPQRQREAQLTGATNYLGIQRVIEIDDDETTTAEQHHRLLGEIPIPLDSQGYLSCAALEPENCVQLSAGAMVESDGTSHEVLIEYKGWAADDEKPFIVQRRKDIESLFRVLALARAPFWPNLLKLRGIVVQEAHHRYGFVFDYPPDSLHKQPMSLQEIIASSTTLDGSSDLENRRRIASELAKSLAALHTAGWVHESMCSRYVVIFEDTESRLAYNKPYLVNFEFARSAGSTTQFASAAADHLRLYQHPDRLQPGKAVKYTQKHDLFSFGIVLLEIGLWQTAENMWRSRQECDKVNGVDNLGAKAMYVALAKEKLGFGMGRKYREAVVALLEADQSSIHLLQNVREACSDSFENS